jgi:NADH:ubiquinone oxidoreductase 49 kD subunit 7
MIHYFKLFIEGFHVLVGEVYVVVEYFKGEFGIYMISDGANKLYCFKICVLGFLYLTALDEMTHDHMITNLITIINTQNIVFNKINR